MDSVHHDEKISIKIDINQKNFFINHIKRRIYEKIF